MSVAYQVETLQDDVVAPLDWLARDALPLWASDGWDSREGGFVEQLSAHGAPDAAADRRVRVQARQIHVMAEAHAASLAETGKLALKGLDYLVATARRPDGRPGYVHMLTGDGAVLDARRDTYDHAFVLLALSSILKLHADAQVLALVDETFAFLDAHIVEPSGALREGVPHVAPRRQNPHMHMFEACLNLYQATGKAQYAERAGAILNVIGSAFTDPGTGLLLEFLSDALTPLGGPEGCVVEPGHMAEWVWLLGRYQRLTGVDAGDLAARFYRGALGYQTQAGFLPDEGDIQGRTTRGSRRCWPQTELVKAHVAAAEMGLTGSTAPAREAMGLLFADYVAPAPRGGWRDQYDAGGRLLEGPIPASTLYHLYWAIVEHGRLCRTE